MYTLNHKRYAYIIGLFFLASIAALWSWNTLAELFNFPLAQYKHAVAAFILLLIVRYGFYGNNRLLHRSANTGHETSNH